MASAGILGRITTLLLCVSLLAGCGYRFAANSGNRIAAGQSIWVAFIVNTTGSTTAQTVLRRALYEESHALRGLSPSDGEASADLRLTGKLISFTGTHISYSALDQVKEYRLDISAELELSRKGGTSPVWKGVLRSSQVYPAGTNLALQKNASEAALEAASRDLAQKFLAAVEQSY